MRGQNLGFLPVRACIVIHDKRIRKPAEILVSIRISDFPHAARPSVVGEHDPRPVVTVHLSEFSQVRCRNLDRAAGIARVAPYPCGALGAFSGLHEPAWYAGIPRAFDKHDTAKPLARDVIAFCESRDSGAISRNDARCRSSHALQPGSISFLAFCLTPCGTGGQKQS